MDHDKKMKIVVGHEIEMLLEERGIRVQDVRRVIAYAEDTKKVFRSTITNHYIAYHRPSKVTFWVEYGREDDSYRIYRAYSHRMEILESLNMPAKHKEKSQEWLCVQCGASLELVTVKLTYLDETFAAEAPACPSCQHVFISEESAVKKMALAEKMLEDK